MKPTLLVLAAGLGRRYGGHKQIDAVGPNGETIIDYSVYDAVGAGFDRVVFVIRRDSEDIFREKVTGRFDRYVQTAFAYQQLDACLGGFEPSGDRDKPWGTGHAILVARSVVNEPFAVINADDYYGPNSLGIMLRFISAGDVYSSEYAMVGYTLKNTLSDYGAVSRGICECDERMMLKKIVERRKIEKTAGGACCLDAEGTRHLFTGDEIVSMNLWGFQPSIFDRLQSQFARFLEDRGSDSGAEFMIPSVADDLVRNSEATIRVLHTDDSWFGVTYRQDKSAVARCIGKLIEEGAYPEKLWTK